MSSNLVFQGPCICFSLLHGYVLGISLWFLLTLGRDSVFVDREGLRHCQMMNGWPLDWNDDQVMSFSGSFKERKSKKSNLRRTIICISWSMPFFCVPVSLITSTDIMSCSMDGLSRSID